MGAPGSSSLLYPAGLRGITAFGGEEVSFDSRSGEVRIIEINLSAVAGPDQKVSAGDTVYFDGAGSTDIIGLILNYAWDYGDGSAGEGVLVDHVFDTPGIYEVRLTISDQFDNIAEDTTLIKALQKTSGLLMVGSVYANPQSEVVLPVSLEGTPELERLNFSITFSPSIVSVRSVESSFNMNERIDEGMVFISLSGVDRDGVLENLSLDIVGNLGFSPSLQLEGIYVLFGGEEVSLYSASAEINVVNNPPVASAGPDQEIALGEIVYLNGTGSNDPDGEIVRYEWDFGDGYFGTDAVLNHTYAEEGVYEIWLKVFDSFDRTGEDSVTVKVVKNATDERISTTDLL